jgi:hypothetical protein
MAISGGNVLLSVNVTATNPQRPKAVHPHSPLHPEHYMVFLY